MQPWVVALVVIGAGVLMAAILLARRGPSGTVAAVPAPLADTMRTLVKDRATGTLRVTSGEQTCSLYYLFGHLFHAECGALEGNTALQTALAWPQVTSVFDKEASLPTKETITGEPDLRPI